MLRLDEAPVFEADNSVGHVKIAIVVRHHDERFAFRFKLGQKLRVK